MNHQLIHFPTVDVLPVTHKIELCLGIEDFK